MTAAFGIGGGVAMLAVLLNVLPPQIVLPIHGIVQAGSNIGRAVVFYKDIHVGIFAWFTLGTILGIIVASFLVVSLPTAVMQLVLALFILWVLWGPKLVKREIQTPGFFFVGAGAAFCTMFIGASGVLVGAFWSVARLGKRGVVATHAACTSTQHTFKVIAFGVLGFVFTEWIGLVFAMVVSGLAGTIMGKQVLARLPEHIFSKIFKLCLTILAGKLLIDALLSLY